MTRPKIETPRRPGIELVRSSYQPSKAELEEDARIDATPGALAWAVTRGGATRAKPDQEEGKA